MRILGIDPGIGRTGWGVIDDNRGKVVVVAYGCIETKAGQPVEQRLLTIYRMIKKIVHKYRPEAVSVEELFFNTNVKTALTVGQARGVILLIAGEENLPLGVYTPLQVKVAVTGYGRAEKNQVGKMVKTILNLEVIPRPDDVADALAVALAHAFSKKVKR